MEIYFHIDLSEYEKSCDGITIGGVIEKHLARIKDCKANCASLIVYNSHMHGSFVVPTAIGFSTPVHDVCVNARLNIGMTLNEAWPDLVVEYSKWKTVYESRVVRKPATITYSTDQSSCCIRLEQYEWATSCRNSRVAILRTPSASEIGN